MLFDIGKYAAVYFTVYYSLPSKTLVSSILYFSSFSNYNSKFCFITLIRLTFHTDSGDLVTPSHKKLCGIELFSHLPLFLCRQYELMIFDVFSST